MKRILMVCVLVLITGVAAYAQRIGYTTRFRQDVGITRLERLQLQRDFLRYRIAGRIAERDGVVTPMEQRRLQKIKRKASRHVIRYRFNSRRRLI